ncbi:MAG: phage virion morphogenesis protein [Micavibrio sp. TMED27]|nr:phage virion morphogenesis protein [Micavibrio sp.]OUT90623.1 MAG: phage virion morphogenesis protein [Micavibrio sp. TMED27]
MIRMEITGQDEALKALSMISSPDTREAILDDYGQYMLTEIDARFENETDPDGDAWAKSYRARTEGGQTLTDDGFLRQSMTQVNDSDRLEIGSNLVYARIHNDGGVIKPKSGNKLKFKIGSHFVTVDSVTIPQRQFLGFNAENEAELFNIINDHWEGLVQ